MDEIAPQSIKKQDVSDKSRKPDWRPKDDFFGPVSTTVITSQSAICTEKEAIQARRST